MANQFSEPEEELTEVKNVADLDPMAQAINEKPYTRPNVKISANDLNADIPEPSFQPPPIDLGKPPVEAAPQKKKEEEKPLNPQMNDLSKKDKEFATDHVAEVIMQGYEWMHDAANKGMVFSDSKMNKLAREGAVDFSIQIPYDYATGSTMSAGEFIQEYNNQNKNALEVSPDFREKTMPVLKRVLAKRGIGMTDEQYLIYLFGKDMALKGFAFMTARSQMNEIIKMMKEMTSERTDGQAAFVPPPPPPTQPVEQEQPVQQNFDVPSHNEVYEIDVDEEREEVYVEEEVIGSVSEQVDAQLQNKSVAQLRREQIEAAKQASRSKPKKPRGRQKK